MNSFDIRSNERARAVLIVFAALAAAACGADKSTGPPGGGGTTEQWATVLTRSWTMPGNSESYQCHTELATADKYYTGFRLASPSAAQTELYVLVRPSVPQVGDYDCALSDFGGGELIYVAGVGTTPVTFSGGKGVHVTSGQYLQMVVHINNNSTSSMSASTTVEGRVGAAKDVTTPIDMFLSGRLQFTLAADSAPESWNFSCATAADMHVVAEIPLMRSLGTHQAFATVDSLAIIHTLFDSDFAFQHSVYTSLPTDFLVTATSRLNSACTYVNTTGVVVNSGESASNELCFLALYRYPAKPPTSASPIECSLGQNI